MMSQSIRIATVVAIALVLLVSTTTATSCNVFTQRVQCGALTCNANTSQCALCTRSEECYEKSMYCNGEGHCVLKSLVDDHGPGLYGAIVVAIAICSIAVVAGVGGGGILVPVYIWLLDFPMSTAVALSQATIAGQSSFNVMLICRRKHPEYHAPATRSVINYEYLSLILPISLAGVLLGSAGNRVAADWMRVVLLYLVLTNVLVRVVMRIRKQMRQDMALTAKEPTTSPDSNKSGNKINDDSPDRRDTRNTIEPSKDEEPDEETPIAVSESTMAPRTVWPQFPPTEIFMCFLSFAVLLAANALRQEFTDCGSNEYWIAFGAPIAFLAGMYVIAWLRFNKVWQDIKAGVVPMENMPFKWSRKTSILFPMIAVTAGGAASMLGIGGGLVLSFLLLEAGLVPEEGSSTSGIATMLVACEAALQFVMQKALPWDYGLLFFFSGCTSTAVGQFIFVKEIKRRGWKFLIIICLAFILGGSMVTLTIYGVMNTVMIVRHHGYLGFGEYCKKM